MGAIQFDEDGSGTYQNMKHFLPQAAEPKTVSWLIKSGVVKNARKAQLILLIIAGLVVAAAIAIFYSTFLQPRTTPPRTVEEYRKLLQP